ncbi:hypothetical protein LAC81_25440 [Ensifer adhaerens]|uniref:hypothetical protein n=1 Tax=Ensifer adhaerens TaxID=106592 RepID=UPI001CC008E6|nr:hypothetical protein [Ensifer adhaerens]MBZ7927043.1 hypothetical protein [Ensifer adhaerens]UAX96656.1 hypothetical protein LAC78_23045 [Ensifer adhaerens]UAY04000.1 hypothetical protein LAC80_21915 [Ensifer adhaerens]UAY11986.1 hypothetical protein LAC81_25440 [Ensifer adhaerens]
MTFERQLENLAPEALVIRIATAVDVHELDSMVRRLATLLGRPDVVESSPDDFLQHGFGAAPRFTAFIASKGRVNLGFAIAIPSFCSRRGHPGVLIDAFFAEPGPEQKLIARGLVSLAIDHCEGRGGRYVEIYRRNSNVGSSLLEGVLQDLHRRNPQIRVATSSEELGIEPLLH